MRTSKSARERLAMPEVTYDPGHVKYLTVKDAAAVVGVAASTLYRWVDRGQVRYAVNRTGVRLVPVDEARALRLERDAIVDANLESTRVGRFEPAPAGRKGRA